MQPDYSRQMLLKEVGAAGQAALAREPRAHRRRRRPGQSRASIPRRRGRRHPRHGRRRLLQASNLHRQPIYALAQVGERKAALAARPSRDRTPPFVSRRMRSASTPTTRSRWCARTTLWSIAPTISAPSSSSTMPPCSPRGPRCSPASINTRASFRSTSPQPIPCLSALPLARRNAPTASSAIAPRRACSVRYPAPSVPCRHSDA